MSDYNEFLTNGAVLPLINNRSVIIDSELSNGFTAYIYKALLKSAVGDSQPVIVKLAKPTAIAAKLVKDEGDILAAMAETGKTFAPSLYATGDYHSRPFLVMEFITASPAFMGNDGGLDKKEELSCLKVMKEVYSFLNVLHEKLKRAYPDMKPDNFFWDEKTNQLRVIDFGGLSNLVLSADEDLRAQSDVMVASTFFFSALSGSRLRVGWNGLEDFAEPKIDQLDISRGTRNLLRKLLCHEAVFRLHNAALATDGVEALINLWNWEGERLTSSIRRNLELARQRQDSDLTFTNQAAERALEALDLYQRRFGVSQESGVSTALFDQAQALSLSSSQLETGKKFLSMHKPELAIKNFTEGKAHSSIPGIFRRWLYLTSVIETIPENETETLINSANTLFQCIEEKDFLTAVEGFKRMRENAQQVLGFEYLVSDAEFFSLYHQAGLAKAAQDFRQAASLLEQAQEYLEKLPDKDEIKQLECGDIENEVTRMRQAAEKAERKSALMSEASSALRNVDTASVLDAYTTLRQVSLNNWDNPVIFEDFYNLFTLKVGQEKFDEAACLFGFLQDFSIIDKATQIRLSCANELLTGIHGIETRNNASLKRALQHLVKIDNEVSSSYIVLLLQKMIGGKAFWVDKDLITLLTKLPKEIQSTEINAFIAQVSAEEQQNQALFVEDVIQQIKKQQFFINSNKIDWSTAETLLRTHSIRDLLAGLQSGAQLQKSELDSLENASLAFDLPESFQNQIKDLQEDLKQQIRDAEHHITNLTPASQLPAILKSTLKSQLEKFESQLAQQNQTISENNNFMTDAFSLLDSILAANLHYGSVPELTTLYLKVLAQIDSVGLAGWRLFQARLEADQSHFDSEIEHLNDNFEKGYVEEVFQELYKIEPLAQLGSTAVELRKKLIAVRMLEKLVTENSQTISLFTYDPNLMSELRTFGNLHIPAIYYSRLNIITYLNTIVETQKQAVDAKRAITGSDNWLTTNDIELDEYRGLIEKWLDATSTLRKINA